MEIRFLSPETTLIMENGKQLTFKLEEKKPSPKECNEILKGISLKSTLGAIKFLGIRIMEERFGVNEKGLEINKLPKDFEVVESQGVKAIRTGGYMCLDNEMIDVTNKAGIVGMWDFEEFIICASKEYSFVIDAILEMIKPEKTRLDLEKLSDGFRFTIYSI